MHTHTHTHARTHTHTVHTHLAVHFSVMESQIFPRVGHALEHPHTARLHLVDSEVSAAVALARAEHAEVVVNVDGLGVGRLQHDDAAMTQHAL